VHRIEYFSIFNINHKKFQSKSTSLSYTILTFRFFRAFVLIETTTNLILLLDDEEKVQPLYGLVRIKNKGNAEMFYPLKSRMYYTVNTK
jgi:hypothetical protein